MNAESDIVMQLAEGEPKSPRKIVVESPEPSTPPTDKKKARRKNSRKLKASITPIQLPDAEVPTSKSPPSNLRPDEGTQSDDDDPLMEEEPAPEEIATILELKSRRDFYIRTLASNGGMRIYQADLKEGRIHMSVLI